MGSLYEGERLISPEEAKNKLFDLGFEKLTDVPWMMGDYLRIMLEIATNPSQEAVDFNQRMRDLISDRHNEYGGDLSLDI